MTKKQEKMRHKYGMLASTIGIITNIFLATLKIIIGAISNSISIISDGINNFMDITSSLVSLLGFQMSRKKADDEHPWGHGRMEYIAALLIDVIIIVVGFELIQSSIGKIITPEIPEFSNTIIIILVIAIVTKIGLFIVYRKIDKKIDSNSVQGMAYDSLSDSLATTVVLISAIVGKVAQIPLDGYAGVVVSIFIIGTGIKAMKETVDILLGERPDPDLIKKLTKEYKRYPQIGGIHDIVVHDYGPSRKFITLHAEVPIDGNITELHEIIDDMENDLGKKYNAVFTIHMDPIVTDDKETIELKKYVTRIVKNINPEFGIQEFRIIKKSRVLFEITVPREAEINQTELIKKVSDKIIQKNSKYIPEIEVDNLYT